MDSLGSFGGSGLPWDSGSKNDPHLRRFLHDLDTYTPRERKVAVGKRQSYRPDTDDDLLRILEESRREYEVDKQMQEGSMELWAWI